MKQLRTILIAAFVVSLLCVLAFTITGCDGSLRFAPTEAQKQVAMRTHLNALAVDADGADPGTAATKQLVEGTSASLTYIGTPAQIAQTPEQYAAAITAANTDAAKRPAGEDVFNAVDGWLALGVSVASLFTGAGAIKATKAIQTAREKSKALREIIVGNELLQAKLKAAGNLGSLDLFKASQNAAQTDSTRLIVANQKITGDGALSKMPPMPPVTFPSA